MAVAASTEKVVIHHPERPAIWKSLAGIGNHFLLRRLFRAFLTIFFVTTLIFFLVRLLPGSPIEVYINQQMTQYGYSYDQAANQARALFAIDTNQPLIIQYFNYLGHLVRGDMG